MSPILAASLLTSQLWVRRNYARGVVYNKKVLVWDFNLFVHLTKNQKKNQFCASLKNQQKKVIKKRKYIYIYHIWYSYYIFRRKKYDTSIPYIIWYTIWYIPV